MSSRHSGCRSLCNAALSSPSPRACNGQSSATSILKQNGLTRSPKRWAREVVDYKIKGGNAINQTTADRDPQAGLYLAGRWLERQPADRFVFAQVLRPGRKRKVFATSLTPTTRSIGQYRATLARIALAASQIDAYYQRFGPDRPWGFADPTSWKCAAQYCEHYLTCPGGAGL